MKVLLLNHNQERFGTYFRCWHLATHLAKLGVQVTLVCASGSTFDLLVRKKKIAKNFTVITLPRVKYHKFFTGQIMRLLITVPIVLFSDYDILHAFTVAQPQIGIPALLAKRLRGKPLIVDWDDLWGGGFAEEHGGIVAGVLGYFERHVPGYADSVTYVSAYLGTMLQSMRLSAKLLRLPNGADVKSVVMTDQKKARARLGLDGKATYVVSVGNTYFAGGLTILFDSMRWLVKKNRNVKLIMVGYTDILPEVAGLFAQIQHSVILPGSVAYQKVLQYMSAADVLALPMEDNAIERARFPIRLGDYLASGKPIVSNACGEVEFVLKKYGCGMATAADDARAFARAIESLLHNSAKAKTLGRKARRVAKQQISWGILAGQLKQLYRRTRYG